MPVISKPNTAPASDPDLHVLHVNPDRPVDIHFSFEQQQSRVGIGASVLSHVLMAVIVFIVLRYAPEAQTLEEPPPMMTDKIVWLAEPGPGGGGGGGGNKAPDPPKKAELPGKEKITVPVKPDPKPQPQPKPEPAPVEELSIPAKTMSAGETPLVGAISSENVSTTSQGSGAGGGAGTGTGTGIGPGQGSGLGPGYGGGTGGGAYRPGSGVTVPRILHEEKPSYTADAMRAKVQGTVWLECVVLPDGSVSDIRVTKSLDRVFGLDEQAVKAAAKWKFIPGTLKGQPVPVLITIELSFNLR
jgi:TonB family protein